MDVLIFEIADILFLISFDSNSVSLDSNNLFKEYKKNNLCTNSRVTISIELKPFHDSTDERVEKNKNIKQEIFIEKDCLNFSRFDLSGTLKNTDNKKVYKGEFLIDPEADVPLGVLMRLCLGFVLSNDNSFLLHASAVVRNGLLWVFTGASGSGKTTIAKELNGGGKPFSLDCVALKQKDGTIFAMPTPFGDISNEVSRMPDMPVNHMIYIEQAPCISLQEISSIKLLKKLIHHGMIPIGELEFEKNKLENASVIAETTKAFSLAFTRDEEFWLHLDDTIVKKKYYRSA